MKAETHHLSVIGRRKSDCRFGRNVMRSRVELGVDHVAGDVERGAFRPLRGGGSGYEQRGGEETEPGTEPAQLVSWFHLVLSYSHRLPYSPGAFLPASLRNAQFVRFPLERSEEHTSELQSRQYIV